MPATCAPTSEVSLIEKLDCIQNQGLVLKSSSYSWLLQLLLQWRIITLFQVQLPKQFQLLEVYGL